LDLAFVLLIIFVITTPLLEQGLKLDLPEGGQQDPPMTKNDFRTLEIGQGFYLLENQRLSLAAVQQQLARDRQLNPGVVVLLRADRTTPYAEIFRIVEVCANLKIGVNFRSEPPNR
jgi:biopolymer transport protein ExbD